MVSTREGQWSQEIIALADSVKPDLLGIDVVWQRFRERHAVHLRRDTGMGDTEFLREALSTALNKRFLPAFAVGLMNADLVEAEFDERLQVVSGPSAYTLHAFQNGDFIPKNALLGAKGLLMSCDRVCRVDIGGKHLGTGVLVRPSLVATAAHVIKTLVDRQSDGTLRARAGSLGELTLTFGDVQDYISDSTRTIRREGEVAQLHENWLAWGSTYTANEGSQSLFDIHDITGITEQDGPWDLALIRLAVPRQMPKWVPATVEPPARPFEIHVLHHAGRPTGTSEPLLWSIGRLERQLGQPAVRYLHDANTVGGSSGAPVFDSNWRIVALHQGGSRNLHSSRGAPSSMANTHNRAVPVCRWMGKLEAIERSFEDVPYLRTVTVAELPQPVVGRRATQQRVWRAMGHQASAAERLLIVRGEQGMGLRFTKLLVGGLVGKHSDGVLATFDVTNTVQLDAAGFAELVTGALSSRYDETGVEVLSTKQSEVRTTIEPALGRRLEQLAAGRPVWLLVEGFERARMNDRQGVDNLLLSLCLNLADYPSLRLVLVGWQATPPEQFVMSVEDLEPPTGEDIVYSCLPAGAEPDPMMIRMAEMLFDSESKGGGGYPAALRTVRAIQSELGGALDPEDGDR